MLFEACSTCTARKLETIMPKYQGNVSVVANHKDKAVVFKRDPEGRFSNENVGEAVAHITACAKKLGYTIGKANPTHNPKDDKSGPAFYSGVQNPDKAKAGWTLAFYNGYNAFSLWAAYVDPAKALANAKAPKVKTTEVL